MKMRALAATTSLVAVAALLTGCGAAGASSTGDGSLDVALSDPIDSWNPQKALATASFAVFPQVFEALLATSPDGSKIEPGLATAYDFDDTATTITFHLDPKARFSNGTAVTSADVAYSEGLWAAGELYGSYFKSIASVAAPDAHTVVFKLSRTDHAVLGILATSNAAVVPKDLGGVAEATFWKKPISAGPYAIASEKVGQSISLVRNKYFLADKNRPAKVNYAVVSDGAQQLLQFQSGKIDVVDKVELNSASQYDKSRLKSTPSSGVSTLMFQTKTPPFDDPNFRKAVALAIDHRALVAGGYAGLAVQATSVLPQIVPGVSACAGCDWSKSDLATATQLVTASKYDGTPITIDVKSGAGPDSLAAQALVPMLAKAGIKAKVQPLALSSYVDKLGKGDFQMGVLTYSALAPSALDPLGFLSATGVLFTKSDPAAANAATAALSAAADDAATKTATAGFETWAYKNTPLIPLAVPSAIYAVSSHVKGFVANHYGAWSAKDVTLG